MVFFLLREARMALLPHHTALFTGLTEDNDQVLVTKMEERESNVYALIKVLSVL